MLSSFQNKQSITIHTSSLNSSSGITNSHKNSSTNSYGYHN
jgi:hypothetical protein